MKHQLLMKHMNEIDQLCAYEYNADLLAEVYFKRIRDIVENIEKDILEEFKKSLAEY